LNTKKTSPGQMAVSALLALGVGVLHSTPIPLTASMAFMITPVLICLFYSWCGPIPSILCAAASMAALHITFGFPVMLAGLFTMILPAAAALVLLRRRAPYFRSMQIMGGVQLAAILSVVAVIFFTQGKSLVDLVMEMVGEMINSLNPALQDVLLAQFSLTGMVDREIYALYSKGEAISEQMRANGIYQMLDNMGYSFRLTLPSLAITSSMLTGVLVVALPTAVCVRRGDEPACPYVPLHEWFIPARSMTGMVFALAACLVLSFMDVSGADAAITAISSLVYMFFALQGLASFSRAFRARGWGRGKRIVVLALFTLLFVDGVRFVGFLSAMLGRKGAITLWMKRRHEQNNKED